MQVGEQILEKPMFLINDHTAESRRESRWGEIVYIHPKGRFHVTEFEVERGKIREAFLDGARAAVPSGAVEPKEKKNMVKYQRKGRKPKK